MAAVEPEKSEVDPELGRQWTALKNRPKQRARFRRDSWANVGLPITDSSWDVGRRLILCREVGLRPSVRRRRIVFAAVGNEAGRVGEFTAHKDIRGAVT